MIHKGWKPFVSFTLPGRMGSTIASGIQRIKQDIYPSTGLDSVKKGVDLARRLINLPNDDKVWLLHDNLHLADFIDHPLVQPILESEELQFRFERLGVRPIARGLVDRCNSGNESADAGSADWKAGQRN